jgi:TatA/E family protein of Tat protein translocase
MIGPQDVWVALALGIFFFGAKKLPELSRSLGQALSEFKKGVAGPEADPPAAPPRADAETTPAKPPPKSDEGALR